MSLLASLKSPVALYGKLERESYRAFHAKTPLHKADHFFNFCITAASMRDCTLEYLDKVIPADKQPYFDAWAQVPALVAASEVANSSKHFVLRDRCTGQQRLIKTRAVRTKTSAFIDFYANANGEVKKAQTSRTEVTVTLSDGTILELYAFTGAVLNYWKSFLLSLGIKVRRQPFARLSGR